MLQMYRQIRQRRIDEGVDSGFTLIELLIVIVVLGILAAVVIFALGGITGQSAVSACQADGATVATAIAAFNAQNPGVTATSANLQSGTTANGNKPYIASWPSNLPHYIYAISSGALYVFTGNSAAAAPYTTALTGAGQKPGAITAAGAGTTITKAANWIAWQGNGPAACAGVQ